MKITSVRRAALTKKISRKQVKGDKWGYLVIGLKTAAEKANIKGVSFGKDKTGIFLRLPLQEGFHGFELTKEIGQFIASARESIKEAGLGKIRMQIYQNKKEARIYLFDA
ncbi:MAG: hypothetical protein V1494_01775 [Candidatus Diapherotrites archaeon]